MARRAVTQLLQAAQWWLRAVPVERVYKTVSPVWGRSPGVLGTLFMPAATVLLDLYQVDLATMVGPEAVAQAARVRAEAPPEILRVLEPRLEVALAVTASITAVMGLWVA